MSKEEDQRLLNRIGNLCREIYCYMNPGTSIHFMFPESKIMIPGKKSGSHGHLIISKPVINLEITSTTINNLNNGGSKNAA